VRLSRAFPILPARAFIGDAEALPSIRQDGRPAKLMALLRALFRRGSPAPPSDPLHSGVPELHDAEIAALYYDRRMGGDFYEFLRVGKSRMLFALLDMAGRRSDTRETLIAAQTRFRTMAPKLFGGEDFNEATAMMNLCYAMNSTILNRGVRSCPAFIGCYNESLGTVCYANCGHTPALLRDGAGITPLEATGLPLGLFSHATQSAATCALTPGAVLLAVSRGIVEAEQGDEEFGLERTTEAFRRATGHSAHALCSDILHAVHSFTQTAPSHNDVTTLVLTRKPCPSL
jgi:sigma-B regulation protein RsbU (phosphoserine phosphatase)